jgi:iron complex outermembrane receptor protein
MCKHEEAPMATASSRPSPTPILVLAALAASAAGAAPAQEALELQPIVVEAAGPPVGLVATAGTAATKTDTPLLETPQSVSVVTERDLVVRNVQTDSQALLYTPGVLAQPFGGEQNQQNPFFTIRGFSSAFGGSFVDGLVSPVNYRYEPYGFERYDILRGPTSTLYGQGDPGGLVNRQSKLPLWEPFREVEVQAGSFDRLQGAFDLSGPLGDGGSLAWRLTALARNADAPMDLDFGQTMPDERQFVAPALSARLGPDTTLTLLGSYLRDEVGQESVYLRPDGSLSHVSLNPPGLGVWNQEQYAAGYQFAHAFADGASFEQTFRYSHMSSSILSAYQGELLPDGRTVSRYTDGNDEWRDDYAIDNRVQLSLATGPLDHDLLVGLDAQYSEDWISFVGGTAPDLDLLAPDYAQPFPNDAVPYFQAKYTGSVVGLYLQDQIRYDDWILTLGARQDWTETEIEDELAGSAQQVRDDAATWRVGLTYLTDIGLAPYASYSTSFLPQAGSTFDGVPFVPTTGEQAEIGVKYQPPGWNGFLSAAAYDIRQRNVLTSDPAHPDCCQVQAGEVRSRGVELQATASLAQLNLNASYAYNDAEITEANPDVFGADVTGNQAPLAPQHLVSAWADYSFARGPAAGLTVGGGVRYVGASFADDANSIENDPYTLVDAVLRYDLGAVAPRFGGAVLALNVSNLLDTGYSTCFTAFFNCNNGAPRTVIGTLSYQW